MTLALGAARAVQHLERADRQVGQHERDHRRQDRPHRPQPDGQQHAQPGGDQRQRGALAEEVEHPGHPVRGRRPVRVGPVGDRPVHSEELVGGERHRQPDQTDQQERVEPPAGRADGP